MKLRPRKPPRFKQSHSAYFLTFCTFNRKPFLHQPGIPEFLIDELHYYEKKINKIVAYTIMPQHIHLLIETESINDLSIFLRDFKKFTSHEIKERILGMGNDESVRIWQPGTMDHCLRISWDKDDFGNHLRYIFYNSYKHLGILPKNFAYHNFMTFVEERSLEKSFFDFDEKLHPDFKKYE